MPRANCDGRKAHFAPTKEVNIDSCKTCFCEFFAGVNNSGRSTELAGPWICAGIG